VRCEHGRTARALERRIKFLLAIIRLAFLLVRLSGFRLDSPRVPDGAAKRSILDAVAHATKAIPLAVALRVLRLSAARYHEWNKRPQDCSLYDRTSWRSKPWVDRECVGAYDVELRDAKNFLQDWTVSCLGRRCLSFAWGQRLGAAECTRD
jgi:hypothetical protein